MWDEDDCEVHQDDLKMYMLQDETLVVPCFRPYCSWAGTLPTSWTDLTTLDDILDVLMPHMSLHPEMEVKREDVRRMNGGSTGIDVISTIAYMKTEIRVMKTKTCVMHELMAGNAESCGKLKYAMRQKYLNVDQGEEFDAWWQSMEQHVLDVDHEAMRRDRGGQQI